MLLCRIGEGSGRDYYSISDTARAYIMSRYQLLFVTKQIYFAAARLCVHALGPKMC